MEIMIEILCYVMAAILMIAYLLSAVAIKAAEKMMRWIDENRTC